MFANEKTVFWFSFGHGQSEQKLPCIVNNLFFKISTLYILKRLIFHQTNKKQ